MVDKTRAHSADLRKGRWSGNSQIYHITSCTLDRSPIFADFDHARNLIRILQEESRRGSCTTLAFVVMPDHFHWLMQLENDRLSCVVGRVKSLAARKIGKPIWQPGFYDHGLRREEDLRQTARYIIMNPVRAGLVERVGLYPHWYAIWI